MARWTKPVPRHSIHCNSNTVNHCWHSASTGTPLLFTPVGAIARKFCIVCGVGLCEVSDAMRG